MKLINETDAAQMIGVKKETLMRWRSERKGPPFYKIYRNVKYCPEAIQAFILEKAVVND